MSLLKRETDEIPLIRRLHDQFRKQGVLSAMAEQVRLALRRFGHYEVLDFVAVLLGYAISGSLFNVEVDDALTHRLEFLTNDLMRGVRRICFEMLLIDETHNESVDISSMTCAQVLSYLCLKDTRNSLF